MIDLFDFQLLPRDFSTGNIRRKIYNRVLTNIRYIYLFCNMALLPFIVKYMLYWTENALFSMLFFQMMLTFGPIIYLNTISPKKIRKREFIKNYISNLKYQCMVGAVLGIIFLVATVVGYLAFVTFFSSYMKNFTLFFEYDVAYLSVMGFFFAFVNPILEELFWRIFIPQSLLIVKQYRLFHEDENQLEQEDDQIQFEKHQIIQKLIKNKNISKQEKKNALLELQKVDDSNSQLTLQKQSCDFDQWVQEKDVVLRKRTKWTIRILFAFYHYFVLELQFCFNVALPVTFAVFLVGLIIEKVKDKYGIISAIILHMGLDFSIVIVIADLLKQGIINKGLQTPSYFGQDYIPQFFQDVNQ